MEASNYSSSSSSTYSLPKAKSGNSLHSPSSILHAVRKSPTKPWKKPAVAPPLPPKPPRVYKVDPVNFRDVVQKLTGATEFQPPRLQTAAPPPPPPLSVAAPLPRPRPRPLPLPPSVEQYIPTTKTVPFWAVHPQDHMMSSGTQEIMKPQKMSDNSSEDPPFSHNWFSFPLLSPGSISSQDQSTYGSLAL